MKPEVIGNQKGYLKLVENVLKEYDAGGEFGIEDIKIKTFFFKNIDEFTFLNMYLKKRVEAGFHLSASKKGFYFTIVIKEQK